MISKSVKFEVVYDYLNDCNNIGNVSKIIDALPLPILHKEILTSRFTNYLQNGEPNPFKCVADDVGKSQAYVQKLYKEIMIETYDHLKQLIIKGKI